MAALTHRCACITTLLLHSILLFLSICEVYSGDRNIMYIEDADFNPEISPFLIHHRHARSNHARLKRQVVNTVSFQRTVRENETDVIYALGAQFTDPQRYVLVSQSSDLFTIDETSGNVFLQSGKRMDYEDDTQRSVELRINATNIVNSSVTTEVILTITVTDVNDAQPEFKNKPYPYLATVAVNTPANQKVYELYAEDPDTTADVSYSLVSGGDGRFTIRTETVFVPNLGTSIKVGSIYTQGQGQFEELRVYQLTCEATDTNANTPQTVIATVSVLVGFRPPQFFEDPFRAFVRENNGIDQTLNNEFKVESKGFQNHTIRYDLRTENNATSPHFSIAADGTIKTQSVLDYESVPREQRPPTYRLNVFASETDPDLQSVAKLIIEVLDDNDNNPIFELSRYSATHPEDLPIDASVLEVKAVDDDSGTNAEVVYSVNHENFYVETVDRSTQSGGPNYVGIIRVKSRLDYDQLPGHMYSFTVTATDKGTPPGTGTANIRVFMTNVNDEPPEILLEDQKLDLSEVAKVGDAVTVIQAVDLDKDQVLFYFSPDRTQYEIFEILPTSGLIRLTQLVPSDRDQYVLNITAIDDGSCCGGITRLSSEAYLNVEIVDVNTHKPSFPECGTYNDAHILENEPEGTQIITVNAVDGDRGENGRVTFTILRSNLQPQNYFNIDRDKGNLTSAIKFDRETTSSYSVTIQGTDQGNPPLDGYCTFRVSIGDVNDNAPRFDQPFYRATISQSYDVDRSVVTVRADDADLGDNARITYEMIDSAGGFFRVEPDAGIIRLNKTLGAVNEYSLRVLAKDGGTPSLSSTATVTIVVTDISSQPPTWDSNDYDQTYYVDETAPVGFIVASFSASSNVDDPGMSFALINNEGQPVQSVQDFGISSGGNTVNLTVFSSMNFNLKNQYDLRLRVTNRGANPLSSEVHPTIALRDTNNEIPYFRGLDTTTGYYPGSIPENAPAGQTVIEIKAYDEDPTSPNNLLTFSIVPKADVSNKFSIQKVDDNTAVLTSLAEFDREEVKQLFLDVKVEDGTESSRPNHPPGEHNTAVATVQIRITDMNDNPPYFEKTYNASVREDASVQEDILTVSARDPDDAAVLTYSITEGNVRGAFGIRSKTGTIFVGRLLDYETEQHVYNLRVNVSDGIYTNSTLVTIHLLDANDNSPVFVNVPYIVEDVVEEDTSITPINRRLLLTVSATDADIDRPTNITYSLLGFGTTEPNKYFEIEAKSGRLYLLTSLDRDLPDGRANYQFNVKAQDEPYPPQGSTDLDQPQFGFTSVQVKPLDINDNRPIFISNMEGSVEEHSSYGSSVMTIVAIDYDEGLNGTVQYEIVEGPSDDSVMKFRILNSSGLILTNTGPDGLDRETTPTYDVVVKASDRGNPSLFTDGNVKISLDDINDQVPVFEKEVYKVNMSEAQTSGSIARVKATDNDIGENARLDYSLNNHLDHFDVEVVNNEGSIVVYKAVDYEDASQRFFNLTVIVQDPKPEHRATAYVEVTVEDFNDNAPVFTTPRIEVDKYEDAPVGTFLAHFTATDADSGINAVFSYSVDRKSDPDRLFSVGDTGNVTLRRMMDREKQDVHNVFILAIDKGDPAQTGTATLIVNVLDVNDNFPIFAQDYRPIVYENDEDVPKKVLDVYAKDLDNDPFGAPFGFAEPQCTDGSDTCPCEGRPTCSYFGLNFLANGDNGNGIAEVSTKQVFDREERKFYYMPIVMWDMRGSGDPQAQTGTNTLTIEIGDINDHDHKPGHQNIFVYNYKGTFGPLEIGTVYATDPDDWDVEDKTFTFTGPKYMEKYFSVNKDSGVITMAKGVPMDRDHTFTVDVYDKVRQVNAECTVTVTVQEISEEAVFSSGSVRLQGIRSDEFVKRPKTPGGDITAYDPSQYDRFKIFIANMLQVPTGNVDVLSVQDKIENKETFTDVRFSAHGSPYYSPSKMNSILALNRQELESQVGVQINQVPIDECLDEKFEGGCYNFLNVTGKPALVNSNGTSFVGVEMFVQATEGCRSDFYPPSDQCTPDYCYNGGTCSQDDWGELHCECIPGMGYNGPRCQGTHHEFNGESYALYDPLEQCENSRTSFYFITGQLDGLILYNGPTTDLDPASEEPADFISLELVAGYPRLRIDHGSGVLELYVDGRNDHGIAKMQRLNDGKWHRIDIVRHGREVEMIVDHCDTAEIGPDETVSDDKMCRRSGTTPDENKFLNVNTLLQLGGRFSAPNYPTGIMPTKFDGCIKELIHNGKLYDLTVPGASDPNHPSGNNRCQREEAICGGSDPKCGDNGICESTWLPDTFTCTCKPGYMGDKCSEEATTKDLKSASFIQWRLKDSFFNIVGSRKLKMNMMFRTRDEDGVLWSVSSTSNNINMKLQILQGRLTLTYDLGDGIRNLELWNRFVSNGAWHSTIVERNGREFVLKMDNGEGANFNFTYGLPTDRQEMLIENTVFAGASVSFADTLPVLASDLENSCVRDIRMDDEWFPMADAENTKSNAATIAKLRNVDNGCVRDDCPVSIQCPPPQVCYPLWGAYECRCPEHYEKINGECIAIDYCASHRCFNLSTCEKDINQDKNYRCLCLPGWTGEFCETPVAAPLMGGITTGAIVAIIVSIFVLLILAVAIILLVRCGRRPNPDDKYILEVDPEDDIRENVINYDEEGAGEEDQDAYDIHRLRKPDAESIHKPPLETMPRRERPLRNAPGENPDVGNFIEDRLGDADDDNDAPPHDSVREFVYEGEGSDAGTLSSLNTSSTGSEQDYDFLNDWGPKFQKLADMYGAGQPGEEDV